jgi:hypothetical protein
VNCYGRVGGTSCGAGWLEARIGKEVRTGFCCCEVGLEVGEGDFLGYGDGVDGAVGWEG